MIRIRATNGDLKDILESYRFVEVCDMDGKVARVLYTDAHGVLHDVEAGSPEAERYRKAFKVDFIAVRSL